MCGIWGLVAKEKLGFFQKDSEIVKQMMLFTAPRGMHSTGIAVTNHKKPKNKPRVWKTVGGPCFILQSQAWDDIDKMIFSEGGAAFGHGRWATKGNITAKNAHPFSHKNITLVHNGTIHSGVTYEENETRPKVEVDSHALCIKMASDGIVEALKDVSGAYAIIAHDADTQSLYFARNSERPLVFAETKDRLYVMSERDALEFLLRRNHNYSINIRSIETEKLYKFDLNDFSLKEGESLKKVYQYNGYSGYGAGNDEWGGEWEGYGNPHYRRMREFAGYDNRKTYPIKKDVIEFLVGGITQEGREFLYEGETDSGQKVEFRTDTNREDLMLKRGKAEVAYEIYRKGEKICFIKFKTIDWLDETKKPETVKTLNGMTVPFDKWEAVVKMEQCGVCDGDIGINDAANTIVDHQGIVCKHCVSKRETVTE